MSETVYAIGQFSKRVNKSIRTRPRWDREGILVAYRTQTGRRFDTEAQADACLGRTPAPEQEKRKTVCYPRGSGSDPKNDLSSQKAALEAFVIAQGLSVEEWPADIGSGLNFKRKHFNALLEAVEKHPIAKIIIAHKDRFVRFGYDWFEGYCQRHGCDNVGINVESLSPEQEVVEDLLTILHCFSSWLYGLRRYQEEIKTMVAGHADE